MPDRSGEAWNDEDIAILAQMIRAGEPLLDVARRLERTPGSIRIRAKRIKLIGTRARPRRA